MLLYFHCKRFDIPDNHHLDSQMTRALAHHLETELVTQRVNAPVEEGRIPDHALR